MKRRLVALAAAALIAVACSAAGSARGTAPADTHALPALTECAALPDRDADRLSDTCELAFAEAFAPILLQSVGDCGFDANIGRIQGGYLHAAQRSGEVRVRVAYLPAYRLDCGWSGPKCLLPGVDCRPHAGDSEFIVIEAKAAADGTWRPSGVFLSAHCFDGDAHDCRWLRDDDLAALEWIGVQPVVWVAEGRHANYPSRSACDRGHHFLDSCDFERRRVEFPVDAQRDIGSAGSPGCAPAPASAVSPQALECPWSGRPFAGWQAGAAGATSYRRYLDEVAGFVDPIDRLAWLAGCWERRTERSITEEQWMAPRGGMMLGMGRVVRGAETVGHEAMRIEQRADALVFVAQPSGQERAEFTATSVSDVEVVFENAAHDFPQRIRYRHAPGDSLHARIDGMEDGVARGVDFRMGRVACGS